MADQQNKLVGNKSALGKLAMTFAKKPHSLETIETFGKGLANLSKDDRITNRENFARKLAEEQAKDTQERD